MAWEPTADMPSKGVVAEGPSFASFDLPQPLVSELNRMGIKTAFPIQAATIADALAGRDILGRARTGSGKTLGFGLPLLASLAASGRGSRLPRAVILAPTRELAMQVANVLVPLAKSLGLRVTLVAGGMAYGPQLRAFERGVDVVVATPGRLIDLMDQAAADLSRVQITVLDEADHMAELGFAKEVQTILDATPADGQRMLFSATLDQTVNALVDKYLTNPITHEVDSNKAAVTTMSHHLIQVAPHDKNATVASIANRKGRTLLFVRTQHGADRVAEQLREAGVMAAALHGGLTQGARARVLAAFRAERLSVLVATDVAARGIHVDDVTLVLQVDPPMNHKDYLHRAGRTARAGEAGKVLTITLPHQRKRMRRLTGQAGVKAAQLATSPAAKELAELAGAEAPSGIAVSGDEYLALVAPPQARPRKYRPARSGQGSRRRRRK
ncbi:MAG: DEAD/DEAH box helicase [Propionibacterium sp.]|nr:MAG: DEAD/DEAH box helicase [Propionibacterium sp.]